jgi:trehalose 6-phosphate synthase/phosphatase
MKSRIDELVGRVNGRFGSLAWTPVLYQYRSLPQDELVPLYAASEVMLVTPLRDGMNLVAKEYVACRVDETGVLILSEMAGAASELGNRDSYLCDISP